MEISRRRRALIYTLKGSKVLQVVGVGWRLLNNDVDVEVEGVLVVVFFFCYSIHGDAVEN